MEDMYKIYLIAFMLTLFLFLYNNKECFSDDFTLPSKYDIHTIYFYSSKSKESLKLKEQMINLKENMNNTTINCYKFRIFIVDLEQYPLTQKKYNIKKTPTIFLMFYDKNKLVYEEFDQNPTFLTLTNAVNNIYTKKIQKASSDTMKARFKALNIKSEELNFEPSNKNNDDITTDDTDSQTLDTIMS